MDRTGGPLWNPSPTAKGETARRFPPLDPPSGGRGSGVQPPSPREVDSPQSGEDGRSVTISSSIERASMSGTPSGAPRRLPRRGSLSLNETDHFFPRLPSGDRRGGAIERMQAFAALTVTADAQPVRFATPKVSFGAFSFPSFFVPHKKKGGRRRRSAGKETPSRRGGHLSREASVTGKPGQKQTGTEVRPLSPCHTYGETYRG